jgi:hypothetical protein
LEPGITVTTSIAVTKGRSTVIVYIPAMAYDGLADMMLMGAPEVALEAFAKAIEKYTDRHATGA